MLGKIISHQHTLTFLYIRIHIIPKSKERKNDLYFAYRKWVLFLGPVIILHYENQWQMNNHKHPSHHHLCLSVIQQPFPVWWAKIIKQDEASQQLELINTKSLITKHKAARATNTTNQSQVSTQFCWSFGCHAFIALADCLILQYWF